MGAKKGLGGRIPHPQIPHLLLEHVRVLRLFALLFLFSLLVLYAVFRSARFQDLLRRRAETLLAEALKRKVTIGGFDLALVPPAFLVKDVSVANDPRGLAGSCFAAEEVSLRGIPQITANRIDLPKVRLIGPRVVLEVFGDGTNNFSSIAEALPKGDGGGKDVRIREAILQKGTIRFREWKAKLDVILTDAALTARSGRFSKTTRVSLGCRHARLKLDEGDVLDLDIGVDLVLSPGRVRFRGIRLRGEEFAIDGIGGIDDLTRPEVNILARARMRGEDLDRYFGAGVPLSGPVSAVASVRVPPGGGFRIRGRFEIGEGGRFGPFPMTGEGSIRVDPDGLLAHVAHADYAGGKLEALVQLGRLKGPPLPVKIAVSGTGIDFERFFSDLGLPGTGLMARADLDMTLTFGPGGAAHADGSGMIRLAPAPGVLSAVRGRHALPVSGGGALFVKDGSIRFPRVPFVTAGGLRATLDGTLRIGTWEPDWELTIEAPDLAEAERLASNFYPAIQGEPLSPPLKLGGSGRLVATLERSFSDPRISGRLEASPFVLHGVPFGETTADFLVDRRVLTLQPLEARDGGGRLVASGRVEWGGDLKGEYRLTGFTTETERWPVERIFSFLTLDLPITGLVSGSLPLGGVTPRVVGEGDLVFEGTSMWGQSFDRVEGRLGFESDRLRFSGVRGVLGSGTARLDGFFRYADDGFEVEAGAEALPVERLGAFAEGAPGLTGRLTGSLSGRGTLDVPKLDLKGTIAEAAWKGSPLVRPGQVASLRLALDGEDLEAEVESPGAVRGTVAGKGSEYNVGLEVRSIAAYSALLGIPSTTALDGTAALEAVFSRDSEGNVASARGRFLSLAAVVGPHTVSLPAPAAFRWAGGQLSWDNVRLAAYRAVGSAGPLPEGELALTGSLETGGAGTLQARAVGTIEAALLTPFLDGATLEGRMGVAASASGTVERPVFEGRVNLDGLELVPSPGATPIEGITGSLQLTPGRISTDDLSMRWNGNLGVAGVLTLDGLRISGMRLNVHLDDLRSEPFPGLRTTMAGDLVLLGDSEVRSARGELRMTRGIYAEDLDLSIQALLGGRRGSAGSLPEATRFDDVALEVRIAIPQGAFEVRNNVARMRGSGDLTVRGTFGRPLLLGSIEAGEGGRLELRGLRYDVTKGKVVFANPAKNDPYFELEARTQVKEYAITLGVSGTASRVVPRFSSYPQLPEAQIVSILATGEIPTTSAGSIGSVSPVSTDQDIVAAARELIAGLATDAAASRTKEFLRLDRLQIDPVFIGSTFDAPRLTVAKRLSSDLTVTYSYKASTDQEQVLLVEYQISPSAFVQFLRDENGVYSAEVKIRQRLR
ncbi:MAG: translocation/assembly module TamB domain-containing protein [Holophagales bacterium]|nr:translocation/assembly module TamB domain-containing protein [Holophagales bacterium]